ncbi:MAG: spore germination protein GerW family protein [Candidatus Marinimicrobia bacterium]|nr:spore germination protein GerW family protein [Candidatus Neomarinimicrobiota bacterium]
MINETIETLLEKAKEIAKTETVIGEPIKAGEVTIIPISKISIGFGAGGGQDNNKNANGEGAGGGINIQPVAIISVYKNSSKLLLLGKKDQTVDKILDLVPNILDRFDLDQKTKKEKK